MACEGYLLAVFIHHVDCCSKNACFGGWMCALLFRGEACDEETCGIYPDRCTWQCGVGGLAVKPKRSHITAPMARNTLPVRGIGACKGAAPEYMFIVSAVPSSVIIGLIENDNHHICVVFELNYRHHESLAMDIELGIYTYGANPAVQQHRYVDVVNQDEVANRMAGFHAGDIADEKCR